MSECKDLSIGDAHTLALRSNGINDFVAARDRLARLVMESVREDVTNIARRFEKMFRKGAAD